jgi:segregation and condensation protein B
MARKRRQTETTDEQTPAEAAPAENTAAEQQPPAEPAAEQQPSAEPAADTEAQPAAEAEAQPAAEAEAQPAAEGEPAPGAVAEPELTPEQQAERLKRGIESLLFITDHPLPLAKLAKCAGLTVKEHKKALEIVEQLRQELAERGSAVQIIEVADGFQMGTKPAFAPFVKKLFSEKMTMRLSTAAHETLSIIAYKQPLTRAEIEQIRGVEVIAAIETLLEKRLIEVVGRRETVGRPLLYGTTTDFLRHFGLRSLEDLPPIDSFTPENAPLGERVSAASAAETPAPTPGEAALEEVPSTEAGEHEDLPVEAGGSAKPLPSCVEAQSKEFAAGEEMAAEREAAAASEASEPEEPKAETFDETQSAPVEADQTPKPKRKTLWD